MSFFPRGIVRILGFCEAPVDPSSRLFSRLPVAGCTDVSGSWKACSAAESFPCGKLFPSSASCRRISCALSKNFLAASWCCWDGENPPGSDAMSVEVSAMPCARLEQKPGICGCPCGWWPLGRACCRAEGGGGGGGWSTTDRYGMNIG